LWRIMVTAPYADIYMLYDLIVTADGLEVDVAENAVYLQPEYKEDFYFVHITDTHLPGHEFWGNEPTGVDFSEIDDLRNVISTINLIRPEFVLFTGDVVNEGELEDLNDRHVYSLAKNLIAEFEVPVFITTGNHDVGGWDGTSPPDGTARHDWHRFFGWEYLEDASDGYYTQNYTFSYDNTLFIGLEAYINYDNFQYNIYGDTSFTNVQMNWLEDVLQDAEEETAVAFYHNDFDEQLDLSSLGLDMTLWGHIHSNSGSITQQPYDLATAAVCDGNCAFRVINVNDNVLTPHNTFYATELADIAFESSNNGHYAQNSVEIHNAYNLDFDNSLIIFTMPHAESYEVDFGEIDYVYDGGMYSDVAVRFSLPASGMVTININAINVPVTNDEVSGVVSLKTYPNPANPDLMIEYSLPQDSPVNITLYNIKGQVVDTIISEQQQKGQHHLNYQPEGKASGLYFLKITTPNEEKYNRVLFIK